MSQGEAERPSMQRGRRESGSSESKGSGRPPSEGAACRPPEPGGEGSSSGWEAEVRHGMKRSQRFCSSFSFGEDDDPVEGDGDGEEGSNATQEAGGSTRREDLFHEAPPPRWGLFRPQELWMAVTRCLAPRWPPCLTIGRRAGGSVKLAYHADQSEAAGSPDSSTNGSSSWTSSSDDVRGGKREEEAKIRSPPARRRGISCTTSRLTRAREAPDPTLASIILEKETFLRIELVDGGKESKDARYWAEWTLSDRAEELAEGVWLHKRQTPMD